MPLYEHLQDYISPWQQWRSILRHLKECKQKHWDLIALPESAVPFRSSHTIYPQEGVEKILWEELGLDKDFLPPLQEPYAAKKIVGEKETWLVSNSYWAQAIANFYQAELVIGMDEQDQFTKKNYNAAFRFVPFSSAIERYEKQVLVPLAEYIPFAFLQPLVKFYGITEFFTAGDGPKVFFGKAALSPSICYEETFSDITREGRRKGAALFVNLTNDNWYPGTLLPNHHFEQGRLRAIENGVPILRACNSGVTAAVDSLGAVVARFEEKEEFLKKTKKGGALSANISLYQYKTLYSFWGDGGIVAISLLFFACFLRFKRKFAL